MVYLVAIVLLLYHTGLSVGNSDVSEDCQAYYDVTFTLKVYQRCDYDETCCGTCYARQCCAATAVAAANHQLKQRKCSNNYIQHVPNDSDDSPPSAGNSTISLRKFMTNLKATDIFDNRFIAEICIGVMLFILFLITLTCCLHQKCKELKMKREQQQQNILAYPFRLQTLQVRNPMLISRLQQHQQPPLIVPRTAMRTSILNSSNTTTTANFYDNNNSNKVDTTNTNNSPTVSSYGDEPPPPYPGV